MRNHGRRRSEARARHAGTQAPLPLVWAAVFLLTFAGAGCGSLMPPFLCAGHSCTTAPPATDAAGVKKPEPGQAPRPPGSADRVVPAAFETPSEALATFAQKLAAAEDDRKVLTVRVQQLENLLEARDQALANSVREVEATRAEVVATRSEMEHWKEKMAILQERLRSIEKEDTGTLESIIKVLEQAVQEGKEIAPVKPAAGLPEKSP
ncbi:MAG TPA: hypothetical protein VKU02_31430 [Gemmataceae bacterium]|nr:hypothetical protein [Gemmataceae bacterium]